ncbi:shikimate kinase [Paenibacillus physcomitrellae]|uniref:shikimate kinase n=1 Tax=Paenibacillus physcomitrellae TaxID=1619311 RepID=UPI001E4E04BE|nr:shikimate kinase [Paenibacillus physcomitrellae]
MDTDILIQEHEGRMLQEILDGEGVERFLEVEEVIVSGLQVVNSIISTGGSVIYSDKAMNTLKQNGQIIYLHVPYEEIKQRLTNISSRGIVIMKGHSLQEVYDERVPLYIKYNDAILDKEIEQCISEIIGIRELE